MKKVGLLVPKTNLTVEYELQYLYNNHFYDINKIAFYISKLDYKTNYKENKVKFLNDIAKDCNRKVKDLEYIGVDYVAFFCTSSSVLNSEIIIENNPFEALVDEAIEKNIKKCLLITPYDNLVGSSIKDELEKNGIFVCKNINLDLLNTKDYFEFGINKLKQFILDNYRDEYENIIISCTNFPTLSIISELESLFGNNIISSNSSLFNKIKKEVVD